MGSLAKVSSDELYWSVPILSAGLIVLCMCRWRINILSMGEEEAMSLGVSIATERGAVILLCTVVSCIAVCLAGTISWVGLVIPHVARLITGSTTDACFPPQICLGGTYVILIDSNCPHHFHERNSSGHSHISDRSAVLCSAAHKKKSGWQG